MTVFFGHFQSLGITINGNHAGRIEHPGTLNGELANRSATPDGDRIARLDISIFSSHITGGENIGQEENLFIPKTVFDLEWPHICKWDPDIFCLSTCIAAQ